MPGEDLILINDMYLQLLDTQWQSLQEIRQGQTKQLEFLLGFARNNAAYFANMASNFDMQKARNFADLWKQVPITSIQQIAQSGNTMILQNMPEKHGKKLPLELISTVHPPVKIVVSQYWMAIRNA
ncbi:hypothetical protein [Pseudemcibacter aquimaris]|uniref:hypothetical protein n=1 Tax=Pseudemcibacter aquimaris TaxID=2857064 RepID=UPI002012D13A|nr:hypothetical protein [Pseudemcibacter aquimaris]MCC3861292.1 hypothetical protein [Pseudemcibacter aquimaris]WDU58066.1 hypothetical protein KW060_12780 [Pseudemcibacter aquimaris]